MARRSEGGARHADRQDQGGREGGLDHEELGDPADVGEDPPALADARGDGREVPLEQDDVGRAARDRRAVAERDRDLGRFIAGTSLTPSPTIATKRPRERRASTSARLSSGVTRPNTATRSATSARASGSVGRSAPAIADVFENPAAPATASTVAGASPERIFTSTPWSSRNATTLAASGRIRSSSTASPSGRKPSGGSALSASASTTGSPRARPKTSTRWRVAWRRAISSPNPPAPMPRARRARSCPRR